MHHVLIGRDNDNKELLSLMFWYSKLCWSRNCKYNLSFSDGIPDSLNHIEHIIYPLDDYIYQHFVLYLTFWHGNGNLLMIQQSKVTWDLKAITKSYCHPTRTRSIKFTTRFIVSRNHEMKSQSLTTNGDTFVKTLKRKFCVYTLSFGRVFLRVSPEHASNIYSKNIHAQII